MRPEWLLARLEQLGLTAGGRGAHPRACLHCGTVVLVGLDEDVAAFTAMVDPDILDEQGELDAILDGRLTYQLTRTATRLELHRRGFWTIMLGQAHRDVVAQHRCRGVPSTRAKEAA